jgi:predicted exporter
MKKLFLKANDPLRICRGKNSGFYLWLACHLALAAAVVAVLAARGVPKINAGFLEMLPQSGGTGTFSTAKAARALSNNQSRSVVALAAAADFERARDAAAELYRDFSASPYFESLTFFVDDAAAAELTAFLYDHRYALLDADTRALLESGGAGRVARDALASVYGAFTLAPLENLVGDPFMLTGRELNAYLALAAKSGGGFSPVGDVLAAEREGRGFVMLRGTLTEAGASFSAKENGVQFMRSRIAACTRNFPGVDVYVSGVPFHSFESSANAKKEISLISSISLALIIALFACYFRSLIPALISALAAALAVATGFGAALVFFRSPHLITLVFGTTLIGTCVDYSIHYFAHLYREAQSGADVRRRIGKGITLGFVSTEICFLLLLAAPFGILKQFAVFSLFGMASSYLSVMFLFPCLPPALFRPRPATPRRIPVSPGPAVRYAIAAAIALCSLSVILVNRNRVDVKNDIRSLYTPSPALLENERAVSEVMDYGRAPWFYIVTGESEQELLENEEKLCGLLAAETGALRSFMAASLFVPSVETQKRNYAASAALLELAGDQFAALGFPPDAGESFAQDFRQQEGRWVLPGSALPALLGDLVSALYLGNIDGGYYSCVFLINPDGESPAFARIAESLPFARLTDTAGNIGESLDALTRTMLVLYLVAFVIIAGAAKLVYPWRTALMVWAFPVLVGLVTLAALLLCGIPIGFFAVTAFLLTFGLGLDYLFYFLEGAKNKQDGAVLSAVILSFATTALSFGALALSSFVPVHTFGVTVLAGLTAAFGFALLFREERHG